MFYLKCKETEEEFPRAYFIKNINQGTEEKKQKNDYELDIGIFSGDYVVHKRINALMLKVATSVELSEATEKNNAVILGEELKFEENKKETKVCECEARVRAFMRMIRIGEGTQDEGGYTRIVGGSSFSDHNKDMSNHPKVYIKKFDSTAAGAYQITKKNWNDQSFINWRKQKKLTDFSKESQDKYCVYLIISKRKAFKLIKNGDIKGAITKCALEWASLPGAGYGQREEKLSKILKAYNAFLKEELEEKTTLHIKKGFLKELYGYTCCNEKLSDVKPSTREGYDIDKAVSYIVSHAEDKSINACAKYVRLAIEAGGLKSNTQPRNALNYFDILRELGFTELQTTSYVKGDIVVFDAVTGHKNGHIAMWTGTEWISDFKQKSIIVNNAYNNGKSSTFRWE